MTAFLWLIYHNTNVDTDEYFMSNKDCTSCPGNKKSLYPGRGGATGAWSLLLFNYLLQGQQ